MAAPFRPPIPPSRLVDRPVFREVRNALDIADLVFVVGPAASGKTTTASVIAHQWPHETLWMAARDAIARDDHGEDLSRAALKSLQDGCALLIWPHLER